MSNVKLVLRPIYRIQDIHKRAPPFHNAGRSIFGSMLRSDFRAAYYFNGSNYNCLYIWRNVIGNISIFQMGDNLSNHNFTRSKGMPACLNEIDAHF